MKKSVSLAVLAVAAMVLSGCAPTVGGNRDESKREYSISADNNSGTIYVNTEKDEQTSSNAENLRGATVSPTTDLAAALSQGGSTTSLVRDGVATLKDLSSAAKYLNERMASNAREAGTTTPAATSTKTDTGTSAATEGEEESTSDSGEMTVEVLDFHGYTNGDRPTFYGDKKMSAYPSAFIVEIEGCEKWSVDKNNGTRSEHGSYLVKQSDVSGRGIAVLGPSSCKSEKATITYVAE